MNNQRRERMTREFAARFGGKPEVWVRAPGRVDLMGSHTDYNQGFVLTLSIDRDTWIAARPRPDRQVVVQSLDLDGVAQFDLDAITHDSEVPWSNYVRGVASTLQGAGLRLTGFDGLVHSTVPLRSGLSSSAALEVATATLFQYLSGLHAGPLDMARWCQRAENEFVGMNCGILDQYSSVFGHTGCALLLDCRVLTSEMIPLAPEVSVVICDTRYKRELTGSEYPERRAACERGARELAQSIPNVAALRDVTLEQFSDREADLEPVIAKRCRFILEENQRVLDLATALPRGDCAAIRGLTQASFQGAGKLYEITVPEMELMHTAMLRAPGVIGARQAGAGFGGCMVAFVERDHVNAFSSAVERAYYAATGIMAGIYSVQAAPGAGLVDRGASDGDPSDGAGGGSDRRADRSHWLA